MHQASPQFSLSALGGGEGRGEVGGSAAPARGPTHLTLPLPPQAGGEGDFSPTRRQILLATVGAALASLAATASATEEEISEAIRDLIGEALLAPGKVKLELPSIVENGNTV